MTVEAKPGVGRISLARTPSGGIAEVAVAKEHVTPQDAALDLSERAGRFDALSTVAASMGFLDVGVGLAGAALNPNSPVLSAVSGGVAFAVSIASSIYLENRGNRLREQVTMLTQIPQRLPTISVPQSTRSEK
jgi:hypothetical protein